MADETGRRLTYLEVSSLADAFLSALVSESDEFTFIQGTVQDRHTLVDGTFDLLAVTARAVALVGWKGGEEFLAD